ncbi:hypothetical protein YOLOSWAG_160 [Erwinia phage vB_EamM_Yoloswag]|uniref:Uncharacterized protein n=1 Tax=Erwinia phage vB_EamM_Yoloswag TaxID=1958956 RepID=A0A1S6L383_9CAUD|nr:DNA polymerase [Erwinia phage vB_EamM_Yoloswag]AQT28640.1 hypothetical protein YOLOSWAG_160 [Erwinia phage vB_EamM_Yoloswag]
MLKFQFDAGEAKHLQSLGVDPQLLWGERDEYDITTAVQDFKPRSNYFKGKMVPKSEQLEYLAHLMDHPLEVEPRITVLSSFPSDHRAKLAALNVFANAVQDTEGRVAKPRWVTLYNDRFDYDKLRATRPSFLVITNITMESTSYKLERLRDILEMFPKVPRVVVTGGNIDPVELFTSRIHLPVAGAVSIGPQHVVKNILDLMTSPL